MYLFTYKHTHTHTHIILGHSINSVSQNLVGKTGDYYKLYQYARAKRASAPETHLFVCLKKCYISVWPIATPSAIIVNVHCLHHTAIV